MSEYDDRAMTESGGDPTHSERPTSPKSRGIVAPVASAVAVVVVAAGGFAAWRFLSDPGPQADEVLPASTFAVASVDLDPDGGQKIEALKALRKFPDLRKQVGEDTDADLMKRLVESGLEDAAGPCKGLTWAHDFKPWIGQSVAAGGVVLDDEKPTWVVAVEAKDVDQAKPRLDAVAKCVADGEKSGWTISGDFVLASDTKQHAEAIAAAGKAHPLSADATYQKWMAQAGDTGIASMYVAKSAPKVAASLIDDAFKDMFAAPNADDMLKDFSTEPPPELAKTMTEKDKADYRAQMEKMRGQFAEQQPAQKQAESPKIGESLEKSAKDFQGMAGVLRFSGGGFEFSLAAGGADRPGAPTVGDQVKDLPADTAAVLAISTPKDLAKQLGSASSEAADLGMFDPKAMAKELGLNLPDDLDALLGAALSVSVGGDAPADLDAVTSAAKVPLGLLVTGDPAKFQAVVAKVEKATGMKLADVPATMKNSDDRVAIASNPSYADKLLGKGDLGSQEAFRDVVPHADKAAGIVFVQLDGSWRAALKKSAAASGKDGEREFANLDAVRAIGLSTWQDGSVSKGLVRVSLR